MFIPIIAAGVLSKIRHEESSTKVTKICFGFVHIFVNKATELSHFMTKSRDFEIPT